MSKSVPSHSTRYSLRHLSPDFQWDTFPDFPSCDENPAEQFLTMQSQSPLPATERKSKEEKKRSSGAIPKSSAATKVQEPACDAVKLPSQENPSGLTSKQPLGTPPVSADDILRLQLQKETQELEIRKLELHLQLAKLENPAQAYEVRSGTKLVFRLVEPLFGFVSSCIEFVSSGVAPISSRRHRVRLVDS